MARYQGYHFALAEQHQKVVTLVSAVIGTTLLRRLPNPSSTTKRDLGTTSERVEGSAGRVGNLFTGRLVGRTLLLQSALASVPSVLVLARIGPWNE